MPNTNRSLVGLAYGIATVIIWAAFPILTTISLAQSFTPNDVSILRFGTAGLVLLPIVIHKGLQSLPPMALLTIVCGAGLPYLLAVTYGLQWSSASHFGLITPSCMLLFTNIGSRLIHKEQISANRLLGIALVIGGLTLVGIDGFASQQSTWRGDLMFVLGGCLWGSYTLSLRHWAIEPLHATALVSCISMLLGIPVVMLFGESHLTTAPIADISIHLIYQGILSAILALVFYSRAVGLLGPSKGSVFGALVPGAALTLAVVFLDEPASVYQLAGVAVIFTGVMVTLEFINLQMLFRKG